ncbi:hypothetical protein NUACC21_40700 [Scytonema sp. NUACC21]
MLPALIDADIVLEWMLNRSPIIEEVEILWYLINNRVIECYMTKIGLGKIHIVLKEFNEPEANRFVSYLENIVKICSVDFNLLQEARKYEIDFETAVEIECAKQKHCYYITQKPQELIKRYYEKVPQLGELWDLLGREFARKMNALIRFKTNNQMAVWAAKQGLGEITKWNRQFEEGYYIVSEEQKLNL